jgi:hypothetical protein
MFHEFSMMVPKKIGINRNAGFSDLSLKIGGLTLTTTLSIKY